MPTHLLVCEAQQARRVIVVANLDSTEEDISGDVLAALQHAELKEMGVGSVGHRLTILKAVYEIKIKQNVPIEPDDYVPLCMCFFLFLVHLASTDCHSSCGHIGTGSPTYPRRLCQGHPSCADARRADTHH
jgi:hypothetical protein